MQSETHTYFWTADLKLLGSAWSRTKLLLSEWRLERLRKQALADVISKGDRRLLQDAGIDTDNPSTQRLEFQENQTLFGYRL